MKSYSHYLLSSKQTVMMMVLAVAGAGVFFSGLVTDPEHLWRCLLMSNFYFLSMSLVAVCFIAMNNLARGGWATVFRRVPEAMTAYLPIGMLLMLALYFGIHSLYEWSHGDLDAVLQQKAVYLNTQSFMLRMVFFFALWYVLIKAILKNSYQQDETGDLTFTNKNTVLCAVFSVIFALSFSLASIDWIMSLEAHWFSTLFPWYTFTSVLAGGLALLTILLIILKRRGFLPDLNEHHLHDMGKYVFAFSFFWGYLWFSQYMLIWYSNMPEETGYYNIRSENGWEPFLVFNLIWNFVIPFLLLLPAAWKKNENWLLAMCVVVFTGHWFDLYVMVMPSLGERPNFGMTEILMFLGVGALFLFMFDRKLRKHPITPAKDPYFEESVHFHGA